MRASAFVRRASAFAGQRHWPLAGRPGATPIIHVYPDQAEIGRVYRPALGIVSELNAFAAAAKAAGAVKKPVWSAWTKELRELRLAQAASAVLVLT